MSRMAKVADDSTAEGPERLTFDAFYRSQWPTMVRFAALTTGSAALAEEIVQDAFADVYRRWASIHSPAGYLRRAVGHRCTSWVRRQQLERRSRPADVSETLDSRVVELLDAMRVLSPRQRAAIVMRYLEDLPEAEIALALSCRPGTVKSLLARALARLEEVVPR